MGSLLCVDLLLILTIDISSDSKKLNITSENVMLVIQTILGNLSYDRSIVQYNTMKSSDRYYDENLDDNVLVFNDTMVHVDTVANWIQ